jgi:hypothetical protein
VAPCLLGMRRLGPDCAAPEGDVVTEHRVVTAGELATWAAQFPADDEVIVEEPDAVSGMRSIWCLRDESHWLPGTTPVIVIEGFEPGS